MHHVTRLSLSLVHVRVHFMAYNITLNCLHACEQVLLDVSKCVTAGLIGHASVLQAAAVQQTACEVNSSGRMVCSPPHSHRIWFALAECAQESLHIIRIIYLSAVWRLSKPISRITNNNRPIPTFAALIHMVIWKNKWFMRYNRSYRNHRDMNRTRDCERNCN